MTTDLDKPALRARQRALRKGLMSSSPQASQALVGHVGGLPAADIVALYHPFGSELDPRPLAAVLRQQGRCLCLPVVVQREEPMIFRRWSLGDPLEPDLAGVPAPLPLAEQVLPKLILTPLLAFDSRGGRLGQGGGHYDRTFAALPEAIRVGVAYAGQEVDNLALEPHDIRLHGILTETGYRAFV